MGNSDRSTAHPVDVWPRTQSATRIPGFCQLRAVGTTVVRHKVNNSYITIFDQRKSNNALDPTETQSAFLLFLIYRVPCETWIRTDGEADDLSWPGIQLLLCWARAALPARLLPCKDHCCHCRVPLCTYWWVFFTKHNHNITSILSSSTLPNCFTLSFFFLQIQTWATLVSMRNLLTWGKQLKPTLPAVALHSVLNGTFFCQSFIDNVFFLNVI